MTMCCTPTPECQAGEAAWDLLLLFSAPETGFPFSKSSSQKRVTAQYLQLGSSYMVRARDTLSPWG